MDLAIKKAKDMGVGWVSARGCNHYGIAGYYAMRAMKQGLIGFCFTNTSPCVVPTGAAQTAIGTNPISCAASGTQSDMVLDMATTTVALGRVEIHQRAGLAIGHSWGVDHEGVPTQDASAILHGGGLMPLGGDEASYKGYGLAMMVEVISAILSGATFGANVVGWRSGRVAANLGQCFIAVDPAKFCPGFEGRMDELIAMMHGLRVARGATEVLVPGEPEQRRQAYAKEHGVPIHVNVVRALDKLANDLGIEPLSSNALAP